MQIRLPALTVAAALLLPGCSTSQPPAISANPLPPPPEISRDLPLEPRAPLPGSVCKLGVSCLELDPRPFEACLVGTKRCVDKAIEPVEVQTPKAPPAPDVMPAGIERGGK
jgi:hypothetical protein